MYTKLCVFYAMLGYVERLTREKHPSIKEVATAYLQCWAVLRTLTSDIEDRTYRPCSLTYRGGPDYGLMGHYTRQAQEALFPVERWLRTKRRHRHILSVAMPSITLAA